MTSFNTPPYSPLSKGQTMNRFERFPIGANSAKRLAVHGVKAFGLVLPIAFIAWVVIFTGQAQSPLHHSFFSTPASDTVLACPPNATARLTALRSENLHRVETLKLKVKGLLPNTSFTVFLASDYLGEIATNADGRGSMRGEALVDGKPALQDPNRAVLRFANPEAVDICFTPVKGLADGNALSPSDVCTLTHRFRRNNC